LNILSVNISDTKGIPKVPVSEIELVVNHGVKNDAHAGPGIRQVSLLAKESYEKMAGGCLKDGSFGENILTQGLVLHKLSIGTLMQIGDVVLEVSKIGKECHAPCNIGKTFGECIMPKEGIFATVQKPGYIKPGDYIKLL